MKKQFFTYWFFTGSILLFLLLNLIFSLLHAGNNFFPALADLIPPLIFALPAVFFRSRTAACATVFVTALTLTIRGLNYGCFVALKEPLTYPVFRLLSEHTEHASLAAVFGGFYYVGVILLILLAGVLLFFWCFFACRSIKADPVAEKQSKVRAVILYSLCGIAALSGIFTTFGTGKTAFSYVTDIARESYREHLRRNRPFRYGYFPSETCLELIRAEIPELLEQNALPPGDRLKKYDRIIVIAVESLDLDYIHAFNSAMPADATPYLDELAAQYPVFRNYFSGAQPTSYAFSSMVLSRMNFDDDLRLGNISLNDELRKLGWKSIYISPTNGKLFDNKADYGTIFRFDEMYFLEDLGQKAETKWGLTDATLLDCAAKILEAETAEKSITFISTMDLHNPYMRSGPAKDQAESVPFLASLRCTDANLRQFITRLQQNEKLWNDRTLILLTADHSATHGANYTQRRDFTPARIPLIVITKNPVKDLPLEKYCSSIDLPATILHQLGLEIPQTFMGQDVFTKKSFALAWSSLDRKLYMHKPGQTVSVNTPALKAFYALFYGQD